MALPQSATCLYQSQPHVRQPCFALAQPRISDTDLNKDLKLFVGAFPQMLSDEQAVVSTEMISARKVPEVLSRIISLKDGTNRDTAAPPVASVVGRG